MRIRNGLIAGLLLCILALAGCPSKKAASDPDPVKAATGAAPAPVSSGRTVTISAITPSTEKPLVSGSKARIAVSVDYTVPDPGGIVGLVVQDSNNASVKSNLKEVPSGTGTLTSEIEFVVPNAKHIDVHVPLYVKGDTKSSQVAVRQFKIVPK